jgi:hypothetical protein
VELPSHEVSVLVLVMALWKQLPNLCFCGQIHA